jgi:Fe-S cluster assembly protein SufD
MSTTVTQIDAFRDAAQSVNGSGPDWLTTLRQEAFEELAATGLPTTRDEEWRFTSIRPIAETVFAPTGVHEISPHAIEPFRFHGLSGQRLVFVNGRFHAKLSDLRSLPEGVRVRRLAEVLAEDPDSLRPHLETEPACADGFSRLNTALMNDGVVVEISAGDVLDQPIHILCLWTADATPRMGHLRHLILAEPDSGVTVLENHAGIGSGVTLATSHTRIVASENANVQHYLLNRDNEQSFNVQTVDAIVAARAKVECHAALLGGFIVRNNIRVRLDGEGADALINGVYLPHDQQRVDSHIRVHHAAPNCTSRQFYKGILADRARSVFAGRIVVDQVAQKTNAEQSCQNLLLSDDAQAHVLPQLEIFADDVRCTHGATTGQLNDDAMFYLQARGIDKPTARGLLLWAFAHEVLDRMSVPGLRAKLEHALLARLPQGAQLQGMLEGA